MHGDILKVNREVTQNEVTSSMASTELECLLYHPEVRTSEVRDDSICGVQQGPFSRGVVLSIQGF